MKRPEFLETKRTPRYSLRKLNVGVASVLLGVTIFGINFTDHSVKAATKSATTVESVGINGSTIMQQNSAVGLRTTGQTSATEKVVQVTMQQLIILKKLRQPHNLHQRRKVVLTLILIHQQQN